LAGLRRAGQLKENTMRDRDCRTCLLRSGAALALVAALACGGSSSGNGEVINCQNDSRVTAYSPNMSVTSSSGAMKFILLSSNPAPPARGTDTWSMRVTDMAGQGLANLNLSVVPFMPDHGHGTSVTPQVTSAGAGNYTVDPLYLFMAGVWRITFTSTPLAGTTDTAVLFFCIPG
jgi:hypothetical protein